MRKNPWLVELKNTLTELDIKSIKNHSFLNKKQHNEQIFILFEIESKTSKIHD